MKRNSYAVVTGASSGIGAEFAKKLASEGYPLVLVARRKERLNALAALIHEAIDEELEIILVKQDLSKASGCKKLMEQLSDKKVGIFINNAGFGDCGPFLEGDLDKEIAMINVNVKAVHILTKLVVQKMQGQNGGYLLNVASSAGLIPAGPYMATYYATKSYVASLTRAVAMELKETKSKVYVGCLCPGPVDTEFNEVANAQFSLKGISAEECVAYAISMMKQRKTVIIPSVPMRAAITCAKVVPDPLYIKITGLQQKKKLKGNLNAD